MLTMSRDANGVGLTGQWSDDVHHAIHTALTDERMGYYEPVRRAPRCRRCHAARIRGARASRPSRTQARRTRAACRRKPVRRVRSEPRPRGQPGRGRSPRPPGRCREGDGRSGASWPSRRSPRSCSKARSGEHRARSASSPTSPILSSPRPCVAGGARSSRAFEWAGEVPDPLSLETFTRSRLEWGSSTVHRISGCSTGIAICSRCVERGQSSQTVAAISCPSTRSTTTCSWCGAGGSRCWW